MMCKKKPDEKKRIFDFYYTELPAIAEYFEKQECEGYRLERFDGNKMVFEKCEPRKIRYCAEIFRGSTPDEFVESCALEGWELAARYNDELYVFRTQKADAIDIMTDSKEKNKICSKRIFRQPGTWLSLITALAYLFRFILYMNSGLGVTLIETSVYNFIALVTISFLLFGTLIKVFDCFLWRLVISNSAEGEKSQFFSLESTVKKRRVYDFANCLFLIVSYLFLIWISPEFFLHKLSISVAVFLIAAFCKSFYTFGKLISDKKDSITKKVLICIVAVAAVVGAFAIGGYMEEKYTGNPPAKFSTADIPVSITDLGVNPEAYEDKGSVQKTRFGQLYVFTSDAEFQDEDEGVSSYLTYNVLVSDYPDVRQKYIDKILDKYSEYGYELVKVVSPDTEWDYYYRFKLKNVNDGENEYDGFAVKDNVVLYLRWPVQCKNNFFEVAYEKIFD